MPSSAATMRVWMSLSLLLSSSACAEASEAREVASVIRYSSIFCADSAPLLSAIFARRVLETAWSSEARACATAASCLRASAFTVASASRARSWPRLTLAPTSTSSSAMRRPPVSGLTMTSCQAGDRPTRLQRLRPILRLGRDHLDCQHAGGLGVGIGHAGVPGRAGQPGDEPQPERHGECRGPDKESGFTVNLIDCLSAAPLLACGGNAGESGCQPPPSAL